MQVGFRGLGFRFEDSVLKGGFRFASEFRTDEVSDGYSSWQHWAAEIMGFQRV